MARTKHRGSGFWDRIARRYARQDIADPDAYQKKIELTRRYLNPESRVLEFGCGTGSTALIHAPLVASVLATDFSEKMIEIARGKQSEAGVGNIEFRCATLEEVPIEDGPFHAVLGLNVLHLMDDWALAIQKSQQLLAPGGVLVTSTVCLSNPFLRLVLPPIGATGLIPRVSFIEPEALVQTMVQFGLDIAERYEPGTDSIFLIARKPG